MLLYSKASKLVLGNKLSLFSDAVILFASGYLVFKKIFAFSISGWLLNNAFHQPMVNVYVVFSGVVLIIAILVKSLSLIFKYFPANNHSNTTPEQISECLQVMNNEIVKHIEKCNSGEMPSISKLNEQHSFDVNTRLIVELMAEHIRKSINSIKVKRKDVFISLYTNNTESNSLDYELHYDHKRDLIKTKKITLTDDRYETYECVKCINSSDSTAYSLVKREYTKGNSKRHKTFRQYMGCKLECNSTVYGFLNIEFHNHNIFVDEEEMQDFMEEIIFPFKLLFEYQYLKAEFFSKFESLQDNWEV